MAITWVRILASAAAPVLATATNAAAEQAEPELATAEQTEPGLVTAQESEPDVVVDVPNLSVQELTLAIENLHAHLSLDTRLASLLSLTVGVDVTTDKVAVQISGLQMRPHLRVRLDKVTQILDRTLTTLDRTALLVQGLVGRGGLLNATVNSVGQTVIRTVDPTGNIVERTVDSTGNIVSQNVVGNVSSLPVVSESKNAAGQTVRQVRDTSGAVIEVTLDAAGKMLNTRVVSQAVAR